MKSKFSFHRGIWIFLGFLTLGVLDLVLFLHYTRIVGFLNLPFWIFYLPLCLWEFFFWFKVYLHPPGLIRPYILSLLFGLLIAGIFRWTLLFFWAICIEICFIFQTSTNEDVR